MGPVIHEITRDTRPASNSAEEEVESTVTNEITKLFQPGQPPCDDEIRSIYQPDAGAVSGGDFKHC